MRLVATPGPSNVRDLGEERKITDPCNAPRAGWPGQRHVEGLLLEEMAKRAPVFTEEFALRFAAESDSSKRVYPDRRAGSDHMSPLHLAKRLANGIVVDERGCWVWQKRLNHSGYGVLTVLGGPFFAYRLALILAGGTMERGREVLHSCDNPPCVNPAHLSFDTHLANMRDMAARGRNPLWEGTYKDRPQAKLTPDDVVNIRARLVAGELYGDIAKAFSVSRFAILSIESGRTWSHVPSVVASPVADRPLVFHRGVRMSHIQRGAANAWCGIALSRLEPEPGRSMDARCCKRCRKEHAKVIRFEQRAEIGRAA